MSIIWCIAAEASGIISTPKLFFEYGELFDVTLCSKISDKPVNDEMVFELESSLPEIDEEWHENGQVLLDTTVRLFKSPFKRRELTVNFILCDTPFTGMSYPLTISMRQFLKSTTESPRSRTWLNYVIYHELLHRYLYADIALFENGSPLLQKYASESRVIRAHLHLLAIQQYVYHALERDTEFDESLNNLSNEYKRAWEIVRKEGPMAFVNEILDSLEKRATH